MEQVIQIIIKKEYAASLLEHLKNEDAIEIIGTEGNLIPEWQKEAVRKSLAEVDENPKSLQSWNDLKKKYQRIA